VDINDKFPPSLLQRVPNPWNWHKEHDNDFPGDETDFNNRVTAMIHTIFEPTDGYIDGDINNIKMSMDIFGPSTTETICLDKSQPTLGLKLCSEQGTVCHIIKECTSGTPAAWLRNWHSRFQHGTLRAINGKYINTIDDARTKIAQLNYVKLQFCRTLRLRNL
jgi:hypothetical protein